MPKGIDIFDAFVLLALVLLGVGAGWEWGIGWGLMAPVPVLLFVGFTRGEAAADKPVQEPTPPDEGKA